MVPAGEGLEPDDVAVGERDDRLVMDRQLAAIDRPAQLVLEGELRHRARVHAALEDRLPPHPLGLGAARGDVRLPEEILGARAALAAERDPDGGGDVQLPVGELERLGERALDPFRGPQGRAGIVDALEEDAELVAGEPGRQRPRSERLTQPSRHSPQQLVAGGVGPGCR